MKDKANEKNDPVKLLVIRDLALFISVFPVPGPESCSGCSFSVELNE